MKELTPDERWAELHALQTEYARFPDFLYDVITGLLGFQCTPMQLDIAEYLEKGPVYRMIQAQRGEAKTTITAIYAVWRLIHNPSTRVLIVSSGDTMATEISNWIIQIINGLDELACLRPDKAHGDRESVKAFDVHYVLKGPEKSPSIACVGITANMQGKRADILIADDVESSKNSQTEVQRARLKHLTLDFSSICTNGDIIYLGTPQSIDSVYNGLASRGFDIRVWPGRYPTDEELPNYGAFLAPSIRNNLLVDPKLKDGGGPMGDRGQPTDPIMMSEAALNKKEIDQGRAYFQLQHMLDTRLMDRDRFPLKPSNLVFMKIPAERAPTEVNWVQAPEYRVHTPSDFFIDVPFYRAHSFSQEYGAFQGTNFHIDPSGGGANGDECAFAVTSFMAGKVYWRAIGGLKGGYGKDLLETIAAEVLKYKPTIVTIEKNYGNGAFKNVVEPVILRKYQCGIEETWATGQKELRIIDTLEPVLSSNRLIVDEEVLRQDVRLCDKYAVQDRPSYSVFYQMARITRDRDALIHDDRLDALEGSVRHWVAMLRQDEQKSTAVAKRKAYEELMADPLGTGRPVKGWKAMHGLNGGVSPLDKHKRMYPR
jgi:hypothetical protein